MKPRSAQLKQEMIEYINSFYLEYRRSPSFQEIGTYFSVNKSTAFRYIREMNEEGIIDYQNGEIIPKVKEKIKDININFPIVGAITCGDPTSEEENIEEYISLPASVFGHGDFYILRAAGDSMVDAGIDAGDLVVIEKTKEASVGNYVVALDENGENTLKRYDGIFDGVPVLSYMNESKYPGWKVPVKSFSCQGIARHVIKTFR